MNSQEYIRQAAERMRKQMEAQDSDRLTRNRRDEIYRQMGFEIVKHGELAKTEYIEVKAVEAAIDQDFYDRGDMYD